MVRRTVTACFLLLALFAAARTGAAQERDTQARLGEVQRAMDGVRRISGIFTQRKKLEFLDEPIVSEGRFRFAKPDSLTWEYTSPAPSGLRIENGKASVWNGPPEARTPQPAAMSAAAGMMAEQVMLWMNFNPREILALYDARVTNESPLTFEVVPRREGLRRHLASITVVLADDVRMVSSVTLAESDATTTLTFGGIRFDDDAPPGTSAGTPE